MKLILVALALVAAVAAQHEQIPQILRSNFDQSPEGGYNYAFETDDGTSHQEFGEVKQVLDEENKPQNVVVMRGEYSYTDELGQKHTLTYVADENGFQPKSEDIPVVPARR